MSEMVGVVRIAPAGRPAVAVHGGSALLHQAVSHVLADGGFRIARDGDEVRVRVLLEPTPAHWHAFEDGVEPLVVLLPGEPDGLALADAVCRGAHAVLCTTTDAARLVDAVARVADGDAALTRAQTSVLVQSLRHYQRSLATPQVSLTPRERQILEAVDRGLSVKQTARLLSISPRTVENTQRVLFRKLAVRNRAQAVAKALALGLLGPESGVAS